MDKYAWQATGDETEVFMLADDEAKPVVIVPFLDSETADQHQSRVRIIVAALNAAEGAAS